MVITVHDDTTCDADKTLTVPLLNAASLNTPSLNLDAVNTNSLYAKDATVIAVHDNTTFDANKTLTAPTMNATTALKVNGTSVSSTYAPLANPTFTGTVSGITKAMVGLANADNTSDALKPISSATQAALDGKVDTTSSGSGVSLLNGRVVKGLEAGSNIAVASSSNNNSLTISAANVETTITPTPPLAKNTRWANTGLGAALQNQLSTDPTGTLTINPITGHGDSLVINSDLPTRGGLCIDNLHTNAATAITVNDDTSFAAGRTLTAPNINT